MGGYKFALEKETEDLLKSDEDLSLNFDNNVDSDELLSINNNEKGLLKDGPNRSQRRLKSKLEGNNKE